MGEKLTVRGETIGSVVNAQTGPTLDLLSLYKELVLSECPFFPIFL